MRDYAAPAMIARFQPIRNALQSDVDFAGIVVEDAAFMAQTTAHLINFQEEMLGKDSREPVDSTKVPHKFFVDYAPRGGLFVILKATLLYKHRQHWRTFNWSTPGRRGEQLAMLGEVRNALKAAGLLVEPRVMFNETISKAKVRKSRLSCLCFVLVCFLFLLC